MATTTEENKTITLEVSDIKKQVRTIIDEVVDTSTLISGDTDEETLDTIIKAMIEPSLEFVMRFADASLLTAMVKSEKATVDTSLIASATIKDMCRFISASCSSWAYDVTEPILWTDKGYGKLFNTYTTGAHDKPKCGIALTDDGGYKISLYKAERVTDSCSVQYIAIPTMGSDSYAIDARIKWALLYQIAGNVLSTLRDASSEVMLNKAALQMGIHRETQ